MDNIIKYLVDNKCARCGVLPSSPDSSVFEISSANAKCCVNCLVYTDFLTCGVYTPPQPPAPPAPRQYTGRVITYVFTSRGLVRQE